MRILRTIFAFALLSVLLAACGPADRLFGGSSVASTSVPELRPAPYGPAELSQGGGIAGVSRSLRLRVDGTYTRIERGQAVGTGVLSAAEHAEVRRLLTSAALAREAAGRPEVLCADAFTYRVTIGRIVVERSDCGTIEDAPTLVAIVDLLGPRLTGGD